MLEKLNLKKDDLLYYDDLLQNKKYETLFHLLEDDILSEATKEMNILKDYLKQENFFDKIAVVDIGWHNSIQYYLEKIFEHEHIDVEMFGFYLGLQSGERKVKNSFAFISDDVNGKYVDSVKSFIGLMESLFLANEGSTIKFQRKDKFIVPVQLEYEYLNDDDEIKCLSKIREGTLKFINIVQRLDDFEIFALNGYDAYLSLKSFGTNPYLQDISMFSKFRYYSEDISYFSNSKGLLMYIRNLKLLKKDFLTSRWKIAFMKETFKINLPYFLIYKVYKKMKGWY